MRASNRKVKRVKHKLILGLKYPKKVFLKIRNVSATKK